MDILNIENCTISYQGQKAAVDDVSLSIGEKEIVSIVGPSGAGKTTLLQIMGTLDMPDGGSVVIDGTQVNRMREKELSAFRNRHIGLCVPVPSTAAGVYGFGECNDTSLHCRKRTAGSQGGGYGNS